MTVELIMCECDVLVTKNIYLKHLKTKRHHYALNKRNATGKPITLKWTL